MAVYGYIRTSRYQQGEEHLIQTGVSRRTGDEEIPLLDSWL